MQHVAELWRPSELYCCVCGRDVEQSEWLQACLALNLGFSRGKALANEIPQKVFFPVEVPVDIFKGRDVDELLFMPH